MFKRAHIAPLIPSLVVHTLNTYLKQQTFQYKNAMQIQMGSGNFI